MNMSDESGFWAPPDFIPDLYKPGPLKKIAISSGDNTFYPVSLTVTEKIYKELMGQDG